MKAARREDFADAVVAACDVVINHSRFTTMNASVTAALALAGFEAQRNTIAALRSTLGELQHKIAWMEEVAGQERGEWARERLEREENVRFHVGVAADLRASRSKLHRELEVLTEGSRRALRERDEEIVRLRSELAAERRVS